MSERRRRAPGGLILMGVFLAIGTPTVQAQMGIGGAGRSLGGYGGATIGQYYGGGTTTYMPYNGGAGGWVPYHGGSAGGFSIGRVSRRLPQTPIGGASMPMTPIGGASRPGGMAAGARGGMGTGASGRVYQPFGYEGGIGVEGGMVGTPMTRQGGQRSPLGPGFRYPFATPPSLSGPSAGTGPSM